MNIRNHALVSAASFALFGVSSMFGAQDVAAAPSLPVNVTNTPLPVNVTNAAVPVQGTVSVGNAVTSPVNVRAVDEPARKPFVMFCGLGSTELSSGVADCYPHINGLYQAQGGNVPAGKRFVIETVTAAYYGDPGIKPASILLETKVADTGTHTYYHANSEGTTCCFFGENYSFVQPVRLYADAGNNLPSVHIVLSGTPATSNFEIYLIGYLVDL